MNILFDVQHLYYLPQYLPVYSKLKESGVKCQFVFYKNEESELQHVCEQIVAQESLDVVWVENWEQALEIYKSKSPDWIVFGNAVQDLNVLHKYSKTVLMQHGIGPKSCYYDVSENPTTVRFVEGQHRLKRLQDLYPTGCFFDSGYAKLDAAFDNQNSSLSLHDLGLDENKPTLLYAPTFYPSSIEMFDKSFANDFSDYNIILKPHFFSLTKKKYAAQLKRLKHFAKQPNVYLAKVADYNLMPFMAISDIMLSDASSAIFEFAALNKPVVWCDFYKLRWSYRGIFKYRFKQRLDSDISYFEQVAIKANSYKDVKNAVSEVEGYPFENRTATIEQLAGTVDGNSAQRIVDYLLDHTS
ncbi:MAG: CDP-glycerol glycerophosphotransferase family protein [Gammaproteobacteria bacterium]|nr:CDP-glycerol glycerophosphotransferase family protein [Gammaproteobacteria bacterium]